eukprot:m.381044 g.381044  ORF g.381044 m.381044 type:complete len:62 (+) comp109838_c0_seq1:74-259(+)
MTILQKFTRYLSFSLSHAQPFRRLPAFISCDVPLNFNLVPLPSHPIFLFFFFHLSCAIQMW